MEEKVVIKCLEQDTQMVNELIPEVQKFYSEFLKEKIQKDTTVELEVLKEQKMKDYEIGGVVLYCNNYKIVFDNSLRARLDLCF